MSTTPFSHQVTVDSGAHGAFAAFTEHLGAWWPLAYTFSLAEFAGAAIEPRPGGKWYEHTHAGELLTWGDVRAFAPGQRVVLGFAIGPDRQPVPDEAASEIEVRFSGAGAGRTLVQIEHRNFERHGAGAEAMRTGMASPQGWPLILAELRRWLASRPTVRYIVSDVDSAVSFYTGHLGFAVDMRPAPGFAALSRGALRLFLNQPGAGGAGASSSDGRTPEPGGWSRLQLRVADLDYEVRRLGGLSFRSGIVQGNGGRQIVLDDPSGNAIELFENKRDTRSDALRS
jgi:catechol 2,3-dioxygenase-like lactoylglutathione lyase family enzyme/uncharacterized protein YndB with AHSA1/START domain